MTTSPAASRLEKKIQKLQAKKQELDSLIASLEQEKKLSDLSLDNPEIRDLDQMVEQAAERLKVSPKKIIAILASKHKVVREAKPVVVKFRDTAPGCENNTWSGRGLPPLWIKRYESVGRSRQEFLVKQ